MGHILIIEDNRDLNCVYRLIMERDGHAVTTAYDGADGLALLGRIRPDVILLDLIMPRMSGVDFLRKADLGQRFPDTKVLVFTNLDHGQEMNSAMQIGAFKYAIKARTTPERLVRVVRAMLTDRPPAG